MVPFEAVEDGPTVGQLKKELKWARFRMDAARRDYHMAEHSRWVLECERLYQEIRALDHEFRG
jgi:hypothetical protein